MGHLATQHGELLAQDQQLERSGGKRSIGPLSWRSSAPSTIICHGPPSLLSRRVPDLRSAGIPPTDSFGQGHRADGAAPRGPRARAAAPWPRALPTRRPSDPCCAQPSTSKVALALLSRHARDPASLAPGALEKQVETLASPARPWTSPARR